MPLAPKGRKGGTAFWKPNWSCLQEALKGALRHLWRIASSDLCRGRGEWQQDCGYSPNTSIKQILSQEINEKSMQWKTVRPILHTSS